MAIFKDDLSIVVCGEAGQGINTVETMLVKLLKNALFNVFSTKEYMSRVRGGSNSTQIRVSSFKVSSPLDRIDIFVPLDEDAIDHLKNRITSQTIIIGDKERLKPKQEIIDIPFMKLASDLGNPIFGNTIAVGVIAGILMLDIESVKRFVKEYFASKPADVIEKNIEAISKGYEAGLKLGINAEIIPDTKVKEHIIINGAEAVSIGAILGGCNFISSYPMSPSTGVLTFLSAKAKEFEIICEQAEDEISAINMVIGAWYSGCRGLVTTSGGGFALMVEGVSLAGITETPVVVHLAQRPGPATGLPTRTQAGDLELALYSGHGDFPRIIYAPKSTTDAVFISAMAFNQADKYQLPVFILTDQYFVDSYYNIQKPDISGFEPKSFIVKTNTDYLRYKITPDGISPRGIPGNGDGLVPADSDEHDESGRITESADIRIAMDDKRRKKIESVINDMIEPELSGPEDYKTLVIGWGSTYHIIKEALAVTGKKDTSLLHFSQVWPVHPKTSEYLKRAKNVIIIENNATAQFAKLIKLATGFDIKNKILKYNGLPFSVEELAAKIGELNA